jgi:hypothetical protein
VLKDPLRSRANLAFDFNNCTPILFKKDELNFQKKTYLAEEAGKGSCNMVANSFTYLRVELEVMRYVTSPAYGTCIREYP